MSMKRAFLLSAVMLMALVHPALADTRSDILATFNRCGVFADDRTWLNCIYGAVQPMRSQLGLPPAPASQTNLVPSTVPMSQLPPPPPPPLPSSPPPPSPAVRQANNGGGSFMAFLAGGQHVLTNMPLTTYGVDRDGLFTVTLANGQVWHEVDGGPASHWHGPASHYHASIVKGSLGSYNLTIIGEGIQYKVLRIR
jgi:hypothetical protein